MGGALEAARLVLLRLRGYQVTAQTAVMIETLYALGGNVHLCANNTACTDDAVAAAIVSSGKVGGVCCVVQT
jgi:S-adenosylhomocysteine hydrolase